MGASIGQGRIEPLVAKELLDGGNAAAGVE